jgi:tight adherence protein B
MDVLRSAVRPITDRLGKEALCPPAGLVMAVLLDSPVPLIAGVLAVPLVRRRLRQAEESKAAARCRAGVIELCDVLAAETRTGRPVNVVLAEAVGNRAWPAGRRTRDAVAGVLAAARFGGDVPTALRALALIPGGEGLRGVAACWQVGVDSGAGLAGGLDRVASGLRAEEQRREELAAQLAGPRATAVLLGVLPLFGLLLGTAMGAAPLDVLLHTPAGLGCLVLGGALEWAGAAWTARIVRGAS